MSIKIQELIKQKEEEGYVHNDLAEFFGVSSSMVTKYRNNFNASLKVATNVYEKHNIVLYPFSESALIEEVTNHKLGQLGELSE